jgi:hypothetical protein
MPKLLAARLHREMNWRSWCHICASSIDFERPAVVEHSRFWPPNDCHTHDFVILNAANAKLRTWNWLMMPVMLSNELVSLS